MKKQEIEVFEKIYPQLEGSYEEISLLSKKSPNDLINKFKLKFINILLDQSNKLLKDKHKPFTDFNLFDDSELPSNSDVVMVLSQYLYSMKKLKSDSTTLALGTLYWNIDGKKSNLKTYSL